tara:strand:- start:232 stop:396 length:165 start_codon:yes stop_codon:yes gene_type:complete
MYLIIGILGAFYGANAARKRKGRKADIAQYAAVYGIIFSLFGLLLTILADRTVI